MIEGFGYKEQWIGTEEISAFTFDFKIFDPSHLHIYVQDQFGNILYDIEGTDTEFISSVAFDPINGGGTINLVNNLPNAFTMTAFLANDYPDQPSSFPNKTSFTLEIIEGALDFIMTCVQRVSYLAQRSIRLHDLDDVYAFDMRLPRLLSENPGAILTINSDGTGFALDSSLSGLMTDINAAVQACLASEIAAANSASDASMRADDSNTEANRAEDALAAVLAAIAGYPLSGIIVHSGPFAAIAPNTNANLLGETTDSSVYTMVEYVARIQRSPATYAKQQFTKFFRNGAWEVAIGNDLFADAGADHGVTFTADPVTGQINAAVANDGGSNATIDLNKINWVI